MARMNKYEREVAEKEQKRLREKERKEREPTVLKSLRAGVEKYTGEPETSAARPKNGTQRNGNGVKRDPGETERSPLEYPSGKVFDTKQQEALKKADAD